MSATMIGAVAVPVGWLLLAVVVVTAVVFLFRRLQSRSRGETASQAAVRRHREAEETGPRVEVERLERRRGGRR
jgi:hypothetical protein